MRRRIQIYREQADTKADIAAFLAVFSLIAIRFLYFGFQYFPQLDDYIQRRGICCIIVEFLDCLHQDLWPVSWTLRFGHGSGRVRLSAFC